MQAADENPSAKRRKVEAQVTPLVAAVASTKGRKQHLEDVPIVCPSLEGSNGALSLYAVLDGHGGRQAADWCAARLPALLAEGLTGVNASAAIKEAIRTAFNQCDAELLEQCRANSWDDGTCAIALLIDRRCSPPRAYVANLGDSRAYAAVLPSADAATSASTAATAIRSVPLSKDHTAVEPKERKRIESSGGFVQNGRVCGLLEVSRSLGDRKLKKGGEATRGSSLSIPTPDVTSFAVGPEQSFVLLACDGLWKVFSGDQAVEWLHERLPKMDARRVEIALALEPPAITALTQQALAALRAERESANEEGCLRAMLHEAVHVRHAKDNVTCILVRLAEMSDHE